ncbi:MAG: hypothetical protein JW794_10485 [Candidatus Cloacimonetes bacterium]|nr:hypothetical protein [Candidatus Cloacimonadota bacterium]
MKYIVFTLNLIAFLVGGGFFVYCLVYVIINPENILHWLIKCAVSLLVTGLIIILYFVRKTHYPCPGIDYK